MRADAKHRWLGVSTIEHASCESTNDEAATLAAAGAAHGTVVTALRQTRGRGRQGRAWVAPTRDAIFWSCVLRPPLTPAQAAGLTLAAGIAVCEAARACGVPATLKWPNDVVVVQHGVVAKLSGILTESVTRGGALDYVIVGVGMNVSDAPTIDGVATTSVHQAGGHGSRAEVLEHLTRAFESWIDQYVGGGVPAISGAWMALAERRCELQVIAGEARRAASLVGLAADGGLIVSIDGALTTIISGDVALGRLLT